MYRVSRGDIYTECEIRFTRPILNDTAISHITTLCFTLKQRVSERVEVLRFCNKKSDGAKS